MVRNSCEITSPTDKPWYHVLVDEAVHSAYAAERNLELDENGSPIKHPILGHFFSGFEDGRYTRDNQVN